MVVGPAWPRESWALETKLGLDYAQTVLGPTLLFLAGTSLLGGPSLPREACEWNREL